MQKCEYLSENFKGILDEFFKERISNPRTRNEYLSNIRHFCDYIGKDFLEADEGDARRYYAHLLYRYEKENSISRNTIGVRFYTYSSVANYIISESQDEYFKNNIFAEYKTPKFNDCVAPDKIITLEELDLLYSAAKENHMHFLIIALAHRACLKATDITRLCIGNIVCYDYIKKIAPTHTDRAGLKENSYFIHIVSNNKNKNDTCILLPDDVREVLLEYLKLLNVDTNLLATTSDNVKATSSTDAEGHLFYNKAKNKLTIRNIDSIMASLVSKANLQSKYTLQDIRNRGIIDMCSAAQDINDIMQYTNLKNTRIRTLANSAKFINNCPANGVNYRLITKEGGTINGG